MQYFSSSARQRSGATDEALTINDTKSLAATWNSHLRLLVGRAPYENEPPDPPIRTGLALVNSDSAGVHFPPPVAYAGGITAGLLLSKFAPVAIVPQSWTWPIAAVFFVAFLVIWIPAFATFVRTKTPLNPNKPVNQLFTSGIYRITRNPLYLSLTLLYLGVAVAVNSLWALVLLVPVMVYIQLGVVRKEEQYLERRFGGEYVAYKRCVRRWL